MQSQGGHGEVQEAQAGCLQEERAGEVRLGGGQAGGLVGILHSKETCSGLRATGREGQAGSWKHLGSSGGFVTEETWGLEKGEPGPPGTAMVSGLNIRKQKVPWMTKITKA